MIVINSVLRWVLGQLLDYTSFRTMSMANSSVPTPFHYWGTLLSSNSDFGSACVWNCPESIFVCFCSLTVFDNGKTSLVRKCCSSWNIDFRTPEAGLLIMGSFSLKFNFSHSYLRRKIAIQSDIRLAMGTLVPQGKNPRNPKQLWINMYLEGFDLGWPVFKPERKEAALNKLKYLRSPG